mgnify:CR=1 FL=1
MNIQKIKKTIDSKNIISFDIFDTLIRRMIKNPHDIFDLIERKYNSLNVGNKISDFKRNRILSEKECRNKSTNEEITIDEIYSNLEKVYDKKQANILKELEKNIEIDFCKGNIKIKEIYNYCVEKNKRIIITSDMYLDENTIKTILRNNKFNYEKLYLSSTVMKTKSSGSIYDYICKDLEINKNEIVHIGDNKKSDFISARKKGLKSILWINEDNINNKLNNNLSENILNCYLNNKDYSKENLFYNVGYNSFGPLLLCFSKWLYSELEENNIKKVYFLARDGYIMKKAFDVINIDKESNYFYASRRSIIVPSLKEYSSYKEMFSSMHIGNRTKIKILLKKVGLDDIIDNINFKEKYNIDINEEIGFDEVYKNQKYIKLFNDLYSQIIENSKEEYNSFISYKDKNKFSGKLAIVDIGWFGNMQHAMEKFGLDVDIYGYYMGVEPRKNYQKIQRMKGFIFETNKNYEYFLYEHNFNSIFEMLFLGQHGSVKRFNCNSENGVEFYDYEYDNSIEKNNIICLQDAAINFVKDFYNSSLYEYLTDDLSCSFLKLAETFINPTKEIAENFGNMKFLDDEDKFIAKPNKLINYLNIKKFIKDYKTCIWRIGFLKRVLKIKLPYYKINMFIRNKYLEKRG